MKSLKHLPNVISGSRIFLCIPIIFLAPFGVPSMVFYLLAGFTDMIDGPLARRIKDGKSELGAILDSVADMLLVIIAILVILPKMETFAWIFPAYLIGLTYKILSAFAGLFKHKQMVLLHTWSNKALGVLLWVGPILYWIFGNCLGVDIYLIAALASIFIITTEEILINLLLKKPNRDIKSIFGVKAANAAAEK